MTDTPALTAEERACDLLNRYSLVWGLETASDRGLQSMIEAIATAIREAENAKLEQAAAKIERDFWNYEEGHPAFQRAAQIIRNLKS